MFYSDELTQSVTRWPITSSGYGPPEVVSGRWGKLKKNKVPQESVRSGLELMSLISETELNVGDCVALGTHTATSPSAVADVHGVRAVSKTEGFDNDGESVTRMTLEPLIIQLRESVIVYPMKLQEYGRGHRSVRGDPSHSGPASVTLMAGTQADRSGSKVVEYNAIVTVPFDAGVNSKTSYEIVWQGPFGEMVLESVGPMWDPMQSPFFRTLACITRRPETGL